MADRPGPECGRWLHSIGHGDPHPGRDRRGAAAVVCGHDEGEGRTGPDRAAAVLHVSAEQGWGPACVRLPEPFYSGWHYRLIRLPGLARACADLESGGKENRLDHRCCCEPAPDVAI